MRLALVTLLLSVVLRPAHAIDVTACGTVVPEGDVGVLQVDLDCGVLPVGVTLSKGARLDLNGHTLRGGARGVLVDVTLTGGYRYRPQHIFSKDGHCRPFSDDADGTVGASGVGVAARAPTAARADPP